MSDAGASAPTRGRTWWIVAGLVVANALLIGLVVRGLVSGGDRARRDGADVSSSAASAQNARAAALSRGDETRPWEANAQAKSQRAALPPGTVPASRVDPPPPDPSLPMPPAPVEPPNPAEHRPPMHNPGGVDGDRPARAVTGID